MFNDLKRLFGGIGLRYQQRIDIDSDGLRVNGIHGVFDIDVCAYAACFLRLSDGGHRKCGFAGRFGAVDLDDPASRETTDAESDV